MRLLFLLLILITGAGCALFMGNYDRNDSLERRVWWIETVISMNDKEGYHYSPLVLALDFNDYPAFEYFLAHGANVNDIDMFGFGPITMAVKKDNIELVERLLKLGANPALPKENPLTRACLIRRGHDYGNIEMVKLLLKYKARVNEPKGYYTPLMMPTNIQIVKLLIQHGANVNACTLDGPVLFHCLSRESTSEIIEVMELLIENGADVNYVFKQGKYGSIDTILSEAALSNASPEIIEFLISRGADINYVFVGEGRDTLLDRAIFHREPPELISLLRKHGAKTVNELVKEGKLPPDPSDDEE